MDYKKDIYQDPEIKKYLKQMTQDQRAFVSLANILLARGFADDAAEICKEGLEKNPNFAAGRAVLGKCFIKLGNKENARIEFENTIKLNPENVVALKGLAEIYYVTQVFDKSLEMYKRLLFIDPMNIETKEIIDKLEQMKTTQDKLREERLEKLKQSQQNATPQNQAPVANTALEGASQEPDTSNTEGQPASEQAPIQEQSVPQTVSDASVSSQPFSQADIDQLIGSSSSNGQMPQINTPQPESVEVPAIASPVKNITKITSVLIDMYMLAGLQEDAKYLSDTLNGGAPVKQTEVPPFNEQHLNEAASTVGDVSKYETEQSGQENTVNNAVTPPDLTDLPASDAPDDEQYPRQQISTNMLDDILDQPSTASVDDILGIAETKPEMTHDANNAIHIISEDVLRPDDVKGFEVTGAENIKWRQGDDAEVEKTIESAEGIVTNDTAAMDMLSETNPEVAQNDAISSSTSYMEPTDMLQDMPLQSAMQDFESAISQPTGLDNTVPDTTPAEGTMITSFDELKQVNDSAADSTADQSQDELLPMGDLSSSPGEITEEVLPMDTSAALSDMTALTESLQSTPSSMPSEDTIEEVSDSSSVSANLTTDENFVPEYRQDAFYSIEDAAQSLNDLQSLMAVTEQNFGEPAQDDQQSMLSEIPRQEPVSSSAEDILEELSGDEAAYKEQAGAMDFAGSGDMNIVNAQQETISPDELQRFASRNEIDMTAAIKESTQLQGNIASFEGKKELDVDQLQIEETAISSSKVNSEEISETLDMDMSMDSHSFAGKNEMALEDLSLTSSTSAPPDQSKELSADTLLLPGTEQKNETVNIDDILSKQEKKNDIDDINNWLKGL